MGRGGGAGRGGGLGVLRGGEGVGKGEGVPPPPPPLLPVVGVEGGRGGGEGVAGGARECVSVGEPPVGVPHKNKSSGGSARGSATVKHVLGCWGTRCSAAGALARCDLGKAASGAPAAAPQKLLAVFSCRCALKVSVCQPTAAPYGAMFPALLNQGL